MSRSRPQARPGDLRISDPRYCTANALAAFVLGAALGAAAYANVASPALALPATIPAALVEVGQYLCKGFDGLKDLARVSADHYAFRCRELAEFPVVQVTYTKEAK